MRGISLCGCSSPVTHLTGAARAQYIRSLFTQVAARYDLLNRLMTGGQDIVWRKQVIDLARLPRGGAVLDLGAGTGDLALEALRRDANLRVIGGDFTLAMMQAGRTRPGGERVRWAGTDALSLPFPDNTFGVVVSGYLMRNVADVPRAFAEQYRVLQPGGRVVCLDTTPPPRNLLRPFINFHLRVVIPALGRFVAGAAEAYAYLPASTENFLPAETLAARMAETGFKEVGFKRLMFGVVALHWGQK